MAKDPDEYKLARYNTIIGKVYSSALEFDKQRLLISSAGLGFMVTRIPIDVSSYPCLIKTTVWLEILWFVTCGFFCIHNLLGNENV